MIDLEGAVKMSYEDNNHWVEETLKDWDVDLIGFADLSEIDTEARHGFKYGISIAIKLKVLPSTTSEASREFHDFFTESNVRLREMSIFLADTIKKRGFDAFSLSFDKINPDNYSAALPYKTLATRAGLGWIGRSACLVTKEYGSAVRITGVLTDMPFETGTPVNSSSCGECMECVKLCPGKAITGKKWDLQTKRDELLIPINCRKATLERGEPLGVTSGSCGMCVAVCSYTKKSTLL